MERPTLDSTSSSTDNNSSSDSNELDFEVRLKNGFYHQLYVYVSKDSRYSYNYNAEQNCFLCEKCQSSIPISQQNIFEIVACINHQCQPTKIGEKCVSMHFGKQKINNVFELNVVNNSKSYKYRYDESSNNFHCLACQEMSYRNECYVYYNKNGIQCVKHDVNHACENMAVNTDSVVTSNLLHAAIAEEPMDGLVEHSFDFGHDDNMGDSNAIQVDAENPTDSNNYDNFGDYRTPSASPVYSAASFFDIHQVTQSNELSPLRTPQMSITPDAESDHMDIENDNLEAEHHEEKQQSGPVTVQCQYSLRQRRPVTYFEKSVARSDDMCGAKKLKPNNAKFKKSSSFRQNQRGIVPSSTVKAPDFEIRTLLNGSRQLFIFPSKNRAFSLRFNYRKDQNLFRCHSCIQKQITVSAKLKTDEQGSEYISVFGEHSCAPLKHFGQNIVKITSYFEEYHNEEHKELLIYRLDDKTSFYRFVYCARKNVYACMACQDAYKFTAAVIKREKEKSFIEADTIHSCNGQVYMQKIKAPMYLLKNQSRYGKVLLIIFEDEKRTSCRKFYWHIGDEKFRCLGCKHKNKTVTAIVWKNIQDEEIVHLYHKHVCEPEVYVERSKR